MYDISTQENVDLWPNLGEVYLRNVSAVIGLLIASDIPEALEPLEIKKRVNMEVHMPREPATTG